MMIGDFKKKIDAKGQSRAQDPFRSNKATSDLLEHNEKLFCRPKLSDILACGL